VVYCSRTCQKAAWKGGHKQECEELQQERGAGSGRAAVQEALRAALLATPRPAMTDRQKRMHDKIVDLFDRKQYRDVVKMAEEGLAVAGELCSARPEIAASIYDMIGGRYNTCHEHVKGLRLFEQARALALEAGDRSVLARVCNSLGQYYRGQGEHAKAIAEYEQARAISVELGSRQGEGLVCPNLGLSYMSLKEYDKAIELFEQALAIDEELGNRSGQAGTRIDLGLCLSQLGQHDRAVACIKQAWAVYQELGDAGLHLALAALHLGEALWAQARAKHHQAAPDAAGCGGICAAGSDTVQEAETWLRTALDLAVKQGFLNLWMDAQMHLACVAMFKGNEDEAVKLLSQHLQWWVGFIGPCRCAGCFQVRGEDAPMLSCDRCRVARCV
jgi:tetratricopeptide (TPR) repeat protein